MMCFCTKYEKDLKAALEIFGLEALIIFTSHNRAASHNHALRDCGLWRQSK